MSSGIPSPAPKRPKKVLGASLVAFESAAEAALPESSASSMCSGTSSMKRLKEAEYELEVAKQHAIMNEMRAQQQQLVMQQNLDASTIRTHAARVEMIRAQVRSSKGSRASNASSAEPAPMPGTDAEGANDLESDLLAVMKGRLPDSMPVPSQLYPSVLGSQHLTTDLLQEHTVRQIVESFETGLPLGSNPQVFQIATPGHS